MEVAAAKQLLPMAPQNPNSPSSSTSSSSPSSAAASPSSHRTHALPPPPASPKPLPRTIDTTPFPTTFVQADTASFKKVVQMLTGADTPPPSQKPATAKNHHHGGAAAGGGGGLCRPKKPAFKLYERRSGLKLKMIAPLAMAAAAAAGPSPRKAVPEVLSPSVLDFPSLALSPVTPLVPDPFNRSPATASPAEGDEASAERAAIAHKGFFLHPSPRGAEPPRLLPLFPVTSPRMASAAVATASTAAAAAPSSE